VKTQAESAAVLHGKGTFDPTRNSEDGEDVHEMGMDDSHTPLVSVISEGIQAYDFISSKFRPCLSSFLFITSRSQGPEEVENSNRLCNPFHLHSFPSTFDF